MSGWSSCRLDQACFSRCSQMDQDIEEAQGAAGLWIALRRPLIEGLSIEKRKGSFVAVVEVGEQRQLGYQSGGEDESSREADWATGLKSC